MDIVIIPGAWEREVGAGMVDSRVPRSCSPWITRDSSGWYSCMRFGFSACTLGSVDASTLAWLSASICPCVFMFEGSAEPSAAATTTRNSLSVRRRRHLDVAAVLTEEFRRRWKVRRLWILQLFQLAEWWSRRPSSSRCAGKKEM